MIFSDHFSHNVLPEKSKTPTCEGLDLKSVYLNASIDTCKILAIESDRFNPGCHETPHCERLAKNGHECAMNLIPYWNYRDELSILDGLILKGSRITIPDACHDEILKLPHDNWNWKTSYTSKKYGHYDLPIITLEEVLFFKCH